MSKFLKIAVLVLLSSGFVSAVFAGDEVEATGPVVTVPAADTAEASAEKAPSDTSAVVETEEKKPVPMKKHKHHKHHEHHVKVEAAAEGDNSASAI